MNKSLSLMRRAAVAAVVLFWPVAQALAANTKTTVEQVTATVTLADDVDYIVTSATPFTTDGVVNIANTDHAVLILDNVRPSAALSLLSAHVRIDGARAVNNSNCQVKLYNRGCIIMPYGKDFRPLTVYSEQNFGGDVCNDFGLEHSGGFMNTLTDKKLNNRIRSFKLKRGYMVTFANRAQGRGYSRCFIAADQDLEVAVLPAVLDRSISSYRVFKWYDTGKPALANDTRASSVNALNVTSCYSFGLGEDRGVDAECVPHHIYENWPSPAACGSVTYSPHLKTNNEPRNQSDPNPQDLNTILDNWENLMATGLRLCTPSSWDGSDYWNGTGFVKTFLDSIDARGWRCDIVDAHCYWNEGNFANLARWASSMKRPIWISEWVWGASWSGGSGIFSAASSWDNPTAADYQKNRDAVERICTGLNNADYIERYFYWNSERNCSKLILDDGTLTPAGEMYAQLNSGVGYNGKYDYAPVVPKQFDPSDLTVEYDKNTQTATLRWHEYNGELNEGIYVERRQGEGYRWNRVADVTMQEQEADYVYADAEGVNGNEYRIHVVDGNGKDRYTRVVMAASTDLEAGDAVTVDGQTKYMGGNMLLNGNFDMGTYGWTNGAGQPIALPYFQVVTAGGINNSCYLQAYGHGFADSEASVKTVLDLQSGADYYFSGSTCANTYTMQQLSLSADGEALSEMAAFMYNTTPNWTTQFSTFNSGSYSKAIVALYMLAAKSQFDELLLCQLFNTREEACANGLAIARQRAAAFKAFNDGLYPVLDQELDALLAALTDTDYASLKAAEQAVDNAIKARRCARDIEAMCQQVNQWRTLGIDGADSLLQLSDDAALSLSASATSIISHCEQLRAALGEFLPTSVNDKIKSPNFANADGWTVKCGTYTGGDQRVNTRDGVSFWNAWWSGLSAAEGTAQNMAIRQQVTGLDHGLYAVECRAATEHCCLSDQHAYITNGTDTLATPVLTADYLDLPTVSEDDTWQTLTSMPLYVADGGSVEVGFVGSKQNAVDHAWRELGNANSTGDLREGWWGATGFTLRFRPMYKATVVPNQFGVICLPYALRATETMRLYQIAAITSDYTALCLEEISESPAGMPCIYRSETADATFMEYGQAVKSTTDAPGNIRGFLKSTSKVPTGYYLLTDGQWNKVGADRPSLTYYTGLIRPFTDKMSKQVPVVDEWAGPTMPINGVTEAEIAADIDLPTVPTMTADGLYTVDGRAVVDGQLRHGVYIKVEQGRAYKTVIR